MIVNILTTALFPDAVLQVSVLVLYASTKANALVAYPPMAKTSAAPPVELFLTRAQLCDARAVGMLATFFQ
jgi:hypothetical protein